MIEDRRQKLEVRSLEQIKNEKTNYDRHDDYLHNGYWLH